MIKVTQGVIDQALERVAMGRALSEVCKMDDDMPSYRTLMAEIRKSEANMAALNVAVEERAQLIFDAVVEEAQREPDVTRARLVFEIRKWSLGLTTPKFAERQRQEITGAGGKPIEINRRMTEAEEEARIAELLAKGGYTKPEG